MIVANSTDEEKESELLFLTCATGFYENFVTPYIYFAELHNPKSKYEFVVSDSEKFLKKHSDALGWLEKHLGAKPLIRSLSSMDVKPKLDNSIRFITEPMQAAKYVYIGDVDIMILENILQWHKPIFDAGLPYSNIVRENTRRLTGLHLTVFREYYPLPSIEDLVRDTLNDEELLYKIVERKGNLYDTEKYNALVRGRPVHGVHMSLNRYPFSWHAERVGWGIAYANAESCERIFGTPSFKEFFSALYSGSKQIVVNLIFLSRGICSYGKEYFGNTVQQ